MGLHCYIMHNYRYFIHIQQNTNAHYLVKLCNNVLHTKLANAE